MFRLGSAGGCALVMASAQHSSLLSESCLKFVFLLMLTIIGRLLKYFANMFNSISSFFQPNRAANPAMLDVFARAKPFMAHHWTGHRADVWSLETLGVKPEYQGKGYGKQLVQWGLERARQDCVSASVIASFDKENFYKACGFGEIVGNVCDGDGNPMAKFKGGELLFKDPEGVGSQ